MQMTPLGAFGPEEKKDGFENSLKCLFFILAQVAVTLHRTRAPLKSEVFTAQQKVMLIVCFVWYDWLGEFLMSKLHLGVAY